MGLIQHDHRVLLEVRVHQTLPEEHAVCHVLYHRLLTGDVLETDQISNLLPKPTPILFRHPLGHAHGRHTTWLGAPNLPPHAQPLLRQVLRDLSGLPAPSLPNDDKDPVVLDGLHQTLLELVDGEALSLLQQGHLGLLAVGRLYPAKGGPLPLGKVRRGCQLLEVVGQVALPSPSWQWIYPGLVDVAWHVVHLCLSLCLSQLPPLLGQGTLGQCCSLQGTIRVLNDLHGAVVGGELCLSPQEGRLLLHQLYLHVLI